LRAHPKRVTFAMVRTSVPGWRQLLQGTGDTPVWRNFGFDEQANERRSVSFPSADKYPTPALKQNGLSQPAAAASQPPSEERAKVERAAKQESIASLKEVFKTSGVVVVAHYAGLTVAQMSVLRKQARLAGASVKVAKNRRANIAL
jgi:hypothetical protein